MQNELQAQSMTCGIPTFRGSCCLSWRRKNAAGREGGTGIAGARMCRERGKKVIRDYDAKTEAQRGQEGERLWCQTQELDLIRGVRGHREFSSKDRTKRMFSIGLSEAGKG